MNKLKSTRRFIVKTPLSENMLDVISDIYFDKYGAIFLMDHIYLKQIDDTIEKIRRVKCDGRIKYFYYSLKKFDTGEIFEKEHEITGTTYSNLYNRKDDNKYHLKKQRYAFTFESCAFALDCFDKPLDGIIILKVHSRDINSAIKLPAGLEIQTEITGDKKFSNYALSQKEI